jgi:hypothetical protein
VSIPQHAKMRAPKRRSLIVGVVVLALVGIAVPLVAGARLGSAAASSTEGGVCTDPVFSSSTAEATDSVTTSSPEYWWVNNDAWSGSHGPQTIYVCNQSSWYAVSNQPNDGGAIETYPDTEYDIGGRDSLNTKPITSFTNITSTFAETYPSAGGWDAAYDLWSNDWTTEVMIWNQWAGTNGYWPVQATIAVTLGGVPYKFFDNGTKGTSNGELMFFRDTQAKSGSVDILAAFQWLVSNGYLKATAEPTQLLYGVEVSYTSGTETFPMTGLTMTVNGRSMTSPTTTTITTQSPSTTTTTAAPPTTTSTSTTRPSATMPTTKPRATTTPTPSGTKVTCTGTEAAGATKFSLTCTTTAG